MMKVLLQTTWSQETYLADVSIRCSNPPQGEMKLGKWDSLFYRLSLGSNGTAGRTTGHAPIS